MQPPQPCNPPMQPAHATPCKPAVRHRARRRRPRHPNQRRLPAVHRGPAARACGRRGHPDRPPLARRLVRVLQGPRGAVGAAAALPPGGGGAGALSDGGVAGGERRYQVGGGVAQRRRAVAPRCGLVLVGLDWDGLDCWLLCRSAWVKNALGCL